MPPTFFEAATATAFELFRACGVEVAIIEVGLGGRFDATNVITPAVGAITTIGYDHQQYLGDTLAEIAFEKAGIIKTGMPVVIGALPPEAAAVVRQVAAERRAAVIEAADGATITAEMSDGAARVSLCTAQDNYGPLVLGLRGEHQVSNALVAVRMLEAVRSHGVQVTRAAIEAGLANPDWPARLELFYLARSAARAGGRGAQHRRRGGARRVSATLASRASCARLRRHARQGRRRDAAGAAASRVVADPHCRAHGPCPAARGARAARRTDRLRTGAPQATAARFRRAWWPIRTMRSTRRSGAPRPVCVAGSIFLAGAIREGLRRRALLR